MANAGLEPETPWTARLYIARNSHYPAMTGPFLSALSLYLNFTELFLWDLLKMGLSSQWRLEMTRIVAQMFAIIPQSWKVTLLNLMIFDLLEDPEEVYSILCNCLLKKKIHAEMISPRSIRQFD